MYNPLVSILMPVYRTAAYLREAVDSMLAQTFTDFELIVLNDCSPDNAEEILNTYNDPRIVRYRGTKNVGLSNILNIGIGMARGQYIARMDSDDVSLPTRIATQVDYLETHPSVDLCSTAMELFGDQTGTWIRSLSPEKVKLDALFFSPVLHASSVWRREAFERHGLRFRQETVPAEDYDLWTRAMLDGLRLVNLPEVLYRYRTRPGQTTITKNEMEQKVRKSYIQSTLPTLTEKQIDKFPCGLLPIMAANRKKHFFHNILLAKRIVKYQCHASPSSYPSTM